MFLYRLRTTFQYHCVHVRYTVCVGGYAATRAVRAPSREGRELGYGAMRIALPGQYAMCSTDAIACWATCGTELGYSAMRMVLPGHYGRFGTELGYGTTGNKL
eukprot:3361884-Rhodomonas_salina.1